MVFFFFKIVIGYHQGLKTQTFTEILSIKFLLVWVCHFWLFFLLCLIVWDKGCTRVFLRLINFHFNFNVLIMLTQCLSPLFFWWLNYSNAVFNISLWRAEIKRSPNTSKNQYILLWNKFNKKHHINFYNTKYKW